MFRTRTNKRLAAGIFGGAAYFASGGSDLALQLRESTINELSQMLDFAVQKITALNPVELVELLASPDNTKIPGVDITVGRFKEAYAEACKLQGCVNLLANFSDVCQGKKNFPMIDFDTGIDLGDAKVDEFAKNVSIIAIEKFKKQALAITATSKSLLNQGVNGLFETSMGKMVEKGANTLATGSQVICSGLTFFAAENTHDHFHANENGYFAYILCGIVSGVAAHKSQEHFANALSLVTTGQNALSSTGMGLAIHVMSYVLQVGIRELEEPTIRTSIKNSATSFINSAIKFISDNGKLLLTGVAVATVGVGVAAYASKK